MTEQLQKLFVGTLSTLGCLCIISGLAIPNMVKFENNSIKKLEVTQKQVTNAKSNEIKLKDIQLEVGNLLSTDTHDYLVNPNDIEESIINHLKLDTSLINTNQIGNYTYTITYNKKIYNGRVTIIQKALPNIDTITLNSLSLEVNQELPKELTAYIQENLPAEVLAAIRLDISNVDITKPGRYLYSISYNGKLYTNTVIIYEPKYGNNEAVVKETKKNS